jgi:Holliday junction resolvasome RuvABC endonuclease subunit
MKLKIVGLDPSLTHTGIAIMEYDTITGTLGTPELRLIVTEGQGKKKVVRQNSDDVRRVREIVKGVHDACNGALFAVSEMPTGAQSSRAAFAFGMVIGVLAGLPVPMIQVSPLEVKLAAVGHKQAAKEEMIEWAHQKYPAANWLRHEKNGRVKTKLGFKEWKAGDLVNDNEHLADAIAVAEAGLLTDQFKQAVAMLSFAKAA